MERWERGKGCSAPYLTCSLITHHTVPSSNEVQNACVHMYVQYVCLYVCVYVWVWVGVCVCVGVGVGVYLIIPCPG